jgi:hypothetical protein
MGPVPVPTFEDFFKIFFGGDMPLFYVYFLSYNTLQNMVGSHHTVYYEA